MMNEENDRYLKKRNNDMSVITIDISSETYAKLAEQARYAGRNIEVFSRELLEDALTFQKAPRPKTAREVL